MTLGDAYDFAVDTFAFGILMYALIVETQTPYDTNIKHVEQRVATNPLFRPVFPDSLPLAPEHLFLVGAMTSCWSHDPEDRPTLDNICSLLEAKLA